MKRILAIAAVCAVLTLLGFSAGPPARETAAAVPPLLGEAGEEMPDGLSTVDENDRFILSISRSDALVCLEDKTEGKRYYSYPPDLEEYAGVDASERGKVKSQLRVDAVTESGSVNTLYSHSDSTENGGLTVKKAGKTAVCAYRFEKERFTVELECALTEGGLTVRVDPGKIVEQGDRKIYAIHVLPYFGAVKEEEEGVLFIPDGSGALISSRSAVRGTYLEDVFGFEPVLEMQRQASFQEKILLPVFGAAKEGAGFIGVIDRAYVKCAVAATTGDNLSTLSAVYPVFHVRTLASVDLPTKNYSTKVVYTLEKYADLTEPLVVNYYPLAGGQADYTAMALRYRQYLLEEKKVEPLETAAYYDGYLEFYGYVKKQKTFLGFPVTVEEKLTGFQQAEEMAGAFADFDARIGVRFNAWIRDGYRDKIPQKAAPASAVGSAGDIRHLRDYLRQNRMQLFLASDPVAAYTSGNGFSSFRHAAKTVNNIAFVEYRFPVNTQYKDVESPLYRLLSPKHLLTFTSRYLRSFNELETGGVAFDTIGNTPYSDYGKDGLSKYRAEEEIVKTLREAARHNEVMVTAAANYAVGAARHTVYSPSEDSRMKLSAKSVPFYQIALRGLINLGTSPINFDSTPRELLLRCYETGLLPLFTFIGEDTAVLKNSDLSDLYAASFDDWKAFSREALEAYAAFNRSIKGKAITAHRELQPRVFETRYQDVTVITNYNPEAVTVNGRTIAAMGCAVEGG